MVGLFANPKLVEYIGVGGAENLPGKESLFHGGSWTLLRWQAEAGLWVILFSGIMTFILLKLVGIFLRSASPTRSWRSAITRSTATRSTPQTCQRSAGRTRRAGSRAAVPSSRLEPEPRGRARAKRWSALPPSGGAQGSERWTVDGPALVAGPLLCPGATAAPGVPFGVDWRPRSDGQGGRR